jgi:hypothetical protein
MRIAIRLLGAMGALLLGVLFVVLRPNPSKSELFGRGGLAWQNALMAVVVYVGALAFGIWVLRVRTPYMKGATELQLMGAALAIAAALFGAGVLAMRLLYGILIS